MVIVTTEKKFDPKIVNKKGNLEKKSAGGSIWADKTEHADAFWIRLFNQFIDSFVSDLHDPDF